MKYIHLFFRILDIVAVVVIGSLLLFGCKAKQIDWAKMCSEKFPIQKEYVQGQTVIVSDTVQLPGIITNADPILIRTKCPGNKIITVTKTRIDTVKAENTAKISALEKEGSSNLQLAKECNQSASESLKLAEKYMKQRNWLLLISFGLLIFALRKTIFNLMKHFINPIV